VLSTINVENFLVKVDEYFENEGSVFGTKLENKIFRLEDSVFRLQDHFLGMSSHGRDSSENFLETVKRLSDNILELKASSSRINTLEGENIYYKKALEECKRDAGKKAEEMNQYTQRIMGLLTDLNTEKKTSEDEVRGLKMKLQEYQFNLNSQAKFGDSGTFDRQNSQKNEEKLSTQLADLKSKFLDYQKKFNREKKEALQEKISTMEQQITN
jgi:chromosome segregation ATPase